jgi:ABC-type glycerol-3-phosphate transport system substrate-binding protein
MRKILIFPAFIIICGLLFFATKSFIGDRPKVTTPSSVTLEYWGISDKFDVSAIMFEGFRKNNPHVFLKYDQKSYKSLREYKDFILSRLNEGTGADVLLVHATWVPEILEKISPAPNFSYTDLESRFFKSSSQQCVASNLVFCIPPLYDGLALIYNKDALLRENITEGPKTWEEFKIIAEKLTKRDDKGKIYFSGVAMGLSDNVTYASDILGLMIAQSDLKIPEGLNDQSAVDALTFYTSFYRDSKTWDEFFEDSITAFAKGKVAMIFAPSSSLYDISKQSPLLNFGTFPVPQIPIEGDKGTTLVNWSSYWVFVVPAGSKNKSVAWDFVSFVTSKDQQVNNFNSQKKYRPFGQVYSIGDLREGIAESEILKPFILGADTAVSAIIADNSGNDEYVEIIQKAITATAKGGNAGGELSAAKSALEQLQTSTIK